MILPLVLLALCTFIVWALVSLFVWALVRIGADAATPAPTLVEAEPEPVPQPRQVAGALVAPAPQAADADEVRQIMRQLGRRDAAGRAMAERILAAAGPRRPL